MNGGDVRDGGEPGFGRPRFRRVRESEFDVPLVCDLCGREAEGDAWPTDPDRGFRFCGGCHERDGFPRLNLIPRPMSAAELAAWDARGNTGW